MVMLCSKDLGKVASLGYFPHHSYIEVQFYHLNYL